MEGGGGGCREALSIADNSGCIAPLKRILGMGEAKRKADADKNKGVYTEYLDRGMDIEALQKERRRQLVRIATIRGRDVLVFAADFSKGNIQGADVSIGYRDQ